jgi:serine/threonine protein kinase
MTPLINGTFGSIYTGKDLDTGVTYAYKYIKDQTIYDHERKVHRSLSAHPNIVGYHGSFKSHGKTGGSIKMEYSSIGDLMTWTNGEPLPESTVVRIIECMADALGFCHDMGYLHRDVKLENILVFNDGLDFKLCDFGMACKVGTNKASGTLAYIAPEVYIDLKVSEKSDVWALGAVMYMLLTGRAFGESEDVVILGRCKEGQWTLRDFVKFVSGNIDDMIKRYVQSWASPQCVDLLRQMLEYHPAKRISMSGISDHPWITGE